MSYNLTKILSVVSKEKTFDDKFLFYDDKEKVCCYNFWCYDVEEKKVKISQINYCEPCNESGEKTFEDYIIVANNDSNTMIGGYEKYKTLKKRHGKNYSVVVLKIKKIKNINFFYFIKNMSFRIFLLTPLKILYKTFNLKKK